MHTSLSDALNTGVSEADIQGRRRYSLEFKKEVLRLIALPGMVLLLSWPWNISTLQKCPEAVSRSRL